MQITRTSKLSGITRTIDVNVSELQMKAWQNGTLIQVAMPELTAAEREFLKSGITAEEWAEAFGE